MGRGGGSRCGDAFYARCGGSGGCLGDGSGRVGAGGVVVTRVVVVVMLIMARSTGADDSRLMIYGSHFRKRCWRWL